jgi:uncharacterized protein (DUF1330 family)
MAAATAATAATAVAVAAVQAPSVEFDDTRIVEMSMQWVRPDGGDSLMSYFQQVFPVAERYGVRALGRLIPEEAVVGDMVPSVIGMVEWPKLESFDGFMADADYRRLYPQRDSALDRLIVTHMRPVEKVSVSFDPDKVYELSGLWIRPDGGRGAPGRLLRPGSTNCCRIWCATSGATRGPAFRLGRFPAR